MENDLSQLLEEWPFESGQIAVRLIEGQDKEPRIQVRLDLGLLQMHTNGRPDGHKPHGFESLLEYFESKIDQSEIDSQIDIETQETAHNEDEDHSEEQYLEAPNLGDDDEQDESSRPARFLSQEDCRLLREEAQQYYHRYIAMLVLEDYEAVVRDTSRNMRVLNLFQSYAINEDDQHAMEAHRPYITMMRARSLASQALKSEENKAAILAIDEGLAALKLYYESIDQPELYEESGEAAMLKDMRDSLIPKLPVSQKAELRQRLEAAIVSENFELAAILRDEIRMLGGKSST
ncbi:MAG: UvrB/UvrC motif-containing protein [Phycisphaerales bacterium]|nr:UvrB/UvrC motif-containing protein [Phycisphaerales bacterium]